MRRFLFFFILVFSYSLYSCVDEDVCDKPSTPRITFVFKDVANTEDYKVDSLIIERVKPDGSIYEEGTYIMSDSTKLFIGIDSISIPMNATSNQTVFYLYKGNKKRIDNKDIITIDYQTEQVFVSKECGFKINYNSIKYQLTEPAKKIEKIEPITTEIKDESENLYIIY